MSQKIKHYECNNCKKTTSAIDIIPKCKCLGTKKEMSEVKI